MPSGPYGQARSRAEHLLYRLAAKLSRHVLWDALLVFLPPLGAVIYITTVLFRTAWIDSSEIWLVMMLAALAAVLGIVLRYRPRVPSISLAAQLIDQRSGAKDRFLTLATIQAANYPTVFVSRLAWETSALADRIELKRDFPYRVKRAAYWSIGASLLATVLIHLLPPMNRIMDASQARSMQLRELARQMAAKPELRSLGQELQALVAKLEDKKITAQEKQQLAQQMENKIEEQQKKEDMKNNRDLLGEAASALEGSKKQLASATQSDKEQQKGGGGIEANLPQKGQGEAKDNQGGGGQNKGDANVQSSSDLQQGTQSQNKPKDAGQDKNLQRSDAANEQNQPDPNQANKEPNKEQLGKTQGGSKEGAGKQPSADQPPPQGASPADRFYASGEGKEGLQGARYVTVQLPEEIAADEDGNSRASKDSKGSGARPRVPVSNVPLPAHIPNAPAEKQQLPIEYRGILR